MKLKATRHRSDLTFRFRVSFCGGEFKFVPETWEFFVDQDVIYALIYKVRDQFYLFAPRENAFDMYINACLWHINACEINEGLIWDGLEVHKLFPKHTKKDEKQQKIQLNELCVWLQLVGIYNCPIFKEPCAYLPNQNKKFQKNQLSLATQCYTILLPLVNLMVQ